MNRVHDLSVAYALDGLDSIQRLRYEPHLAECELCRGDVEDVRDAAELLSVGVVLTPPDSLRARVAAIPEVAISQESASASPGTRAETGETRAAPVRRRRWFRS